jgi:tetratricopeptide (TPR) repeat protein
MQMRRFSITAAPFLLFLVLSLPNSGHGSGEQRGSRAETHADTWVEVQSAHFVVASNAGEAEARRIAAEFERVRSIFHAAFPKFRVDPAQPIVILAARDEITMKTIAPDEWEGDRHIRPAGLFHSDGEKDYVVLRLDAEGTTAFHTIYHEYTHALLFLNFSRLPLWLGEGLAEFFGNSVIGDNDVHTGTADRAHLLMLSKGEWLPMSTLLGVTRDSPDYNEKNPASIFYAESWAVAHFLLLDPAARHDQLLNKYLAAWGRSNNEIAAGQQAFGDLDRFGQTIKKYVQTADWRVGIVVPAKVDAAGTFTARALSQGEVLALRGDFLIHRKQFEAAEPLLEEAVKVSPGVPRTHDALGLFEFRSGNFEDAEEELTRAVKLGSRDFMTFYCLGVLKLRSLAANDEATHEAMAALEHAAQLNPRYAPTFEALTQAYSRSSATQSKALQAAKTTVELDPDSRSYKFGLAYVLLNSGHALEASDVAQKLLATASTEEETATAKRLVATIDEEKEWEHESSDEGEMSGGNGSATADPKDDAAAAATSPKASPAPSATAKRQLPTPEWMALDGEITSMACERSPEITITLTLPNGPMSFHAADFRRVGVSATSEAGVPGLETCSAWTGRRVKVWFRWVQGKDWVGEITKVYFF